MEGGDHYLWAVAAQRMKTAELGTLFIYSIQGVKLTARSVGQLAGNCLPSFTTGPICLSVWSPLTIMLIFFGHLPVFTFTRIIMIVFLERLFM